MGDSEFDLFSESEEGSVGAGTPSTQLSTQVSQPGTNKSGTVTTSTYESSLTCQAE